MKRRGHALPAILTFALVAGVSTLPGGIGQVGRTGPGGGGSGGVTFNPTITVLINNQPVEDRILNDPDSLCNQIDSYPGYSCFAVPPADPFGVNDNTFQVDKDPNSELGTLKVFATDDNIDSVGVQINEGRMHAIFSVPLGTNNDGNYRLRLRTMTGPSVNLDIPTNVPATDTVPEILAAIETSLTAAGFRIWAMSDSLEVTIGGDVVTAVQVEYTDSAQDGFPLFAKLEGRSGSVPTLTQYGMFFLVLLLTGAAFVMMRRKEHPSR